jgi:hypothetical protein
VVVNLLCHCISCYASSVVVVASSSILVVVNCTSFVVVVTCSSIVVVVTCSAIEVGDTSKLERKDAGLHPLLFLVKH